MPGSGSARSPSSLKARWRRLRDGRDRGDATVEAVIIVPVIVVLTLLVVQFVLVWHGRHVAQAAAQTAARSAAAYQAQPAVGGPRATSTSRRWHRTCFQAGQFP